MKTVNTVITYAATVLFGCAAVIAIASTTAVTKVAPALHVNTPAPAVEVVRLEPIVVTISKARFEELRAQDTQLARAQDAKKVKHG